MKNAWNLLGTVAGYLGIAICVVAVAGRFYGAPAFLGFAARSVLLMGIASMWCSPDFVDTELGC